MKDILISKNVTVIEALKKLDQTAERVLLIVDSDKRLLGTITDGDIRRYILKGLNLKGSINNTYNKSPIYLYEDEFELEKAKDLLIKHHIELIPLLDRENRVVNHISWIKSFSDDDFQKPNSSQIDVPVAIMAGGKGQRLYPFTKILPKPLIPVGEKPIIQHIVDYFEKQGVNEFFLTLNYKGEIIESFFNGIKKDYSLNYVWEDAYLGTAGSLKLLYDRISDPFIVTNCDIIVRAEFDRIVAYHKENNAALTILSSIKHHKLPYGVIKIEDEGSVAKIIEKPEYSHIINTGLYIMSKDCLKLIPSETAYDMTDLVKDLLENHKKVLTYPVNEKAFIDIGEWDEYKNTVRYLKDLGV